MTSRDQQIENSGNRILSGSYKGKSEPNGISIFVESIPASNDKCKYVNVRQGQVVRARLDRGALSTLSSLHSACTLAVLCCCVRQYTMQTRKNPSYSEVALASAKDYLQLAFVDIRGWRWRICPKSVEAAGKLRECRSNISSVCRGFNNATVEAGK